MAKISNAKEARKNGGYSRLFNNIELGQLFSKTHSTLISAGTELEKKVSTGFTTLSKEELEFLINGNFEKLKNNIFVLSKKEIKHFKDKGLIEKQPDFIYIDIQNKTIFVIELKDGDNFDTKKSNGEIISLKYTVEQLRLIEAFRNFTITFKVSCFNVESEEEILKGLKGSLKEGEALRGKDLTVLFNIDYDEIIEERKKDGCENIASMFHNC